MRKIFLVPTVALLSFGTAMLATTGANAQLLGPASLIQSEMAIANAESATAIIEVQNRKRKRMRRGNRGRNNGAAAAGIIGAIVGGAIIANEANRAHRRHGRRADRHIDWCYDRYRSYRESDNTYQPYHGRRRQCNSPYY